MPKPALYDFCAFCGNHAEMRGEHMFDRWLRRYIPRIKKSYEALHVTVDEGGVEEIVLVHKGDPAYRKIHCVCENCNTGWMSVATNAAKPFVRALIKGESLRISPGDQIKLRLWIAIKVVTSEYTSLDTKSISAQDRDYIFQRKDAPPDWRIWLGNIGNPTEVCTYSHFPFPAKLEGFLQHSQTYSNKFNGHATIYTVENMFIHVVTAPYAGIFHDWRMPDDLAPYLRQIGPLSGFDVVSPLRPMDANQVNVASHAFRRFIFAVAARIHGVKLPDFR